MILVLAAGLACGLAVHVARRYRKPSEPRGGGISKPSEPRGGGISGSTMATADELRLDHSLWYYGRTAAARPIRWHLTITRIGETKPLFQDDFGTLSQLDPDPAGPSFMLKKHWSKIDWRTFYRSNLQKTLPLKLPPGSYWVEVEARDGLKVRDKTGKIVDRGEPMGGSSGSRIVLR
jgi:hypothetical protein